MYELLENISIEDLRDLLNILLLIATAILGPKLRKYVKLVKVLSNAIDDDQITKEEAKKIKNAADKL